MIVLALAEEWLEPRTLITLISVIIGLAGCMLYAICRSHVQGCIAHRRFPHRRLGLCSAGLPDGDDNAASSIMGMAAFLARTMGLPHRRKASRRA